jgi:hypothetical protein
VKKPLALPFWPIVAEASGRAVMFLDVFSCGHSLLPDGRLLVEGRGTRLFSAELFSPLTRSHTVPEIFDPGMITFTIG